MKSLFGVYLKRPDKLRNKLLIPHGNGATDAYNSSGFFNNKMEAKKFRNWYRKKHNITNVFVGRGPDHIGAHGNHNKRKDYKHEY